MNECSEITVGELLRFLDAERVRTANPNNMSLSIYYAETAQKIKRVLNLYIKDKGLKNDKIFSKERN